MSWIPEPENILAVNRHSLRNVSILVVAFAVSSCARSPSMDVLHFWGNAHPKEDRMRREAYAVAHPELAPEVKEKILKGDLWKGMSKDEAIASRGLPHDIWRNFSGDKDLEKWIYRYTYYFPENFLVFNRTSLVEWEDGWSHKD